MGRYSTTFPSASSMTPNRSSVDTVSANATAGIAAKHKMQAKINDRNFFHNKYFLSKLNKFCQSLTHRFSI